MSASKPQMSSEVRIGHSLNKHEEEFVTTRKQTVLQSLKKHGINCRLDNVPKIALLGSGGGVRAMLGLLGSLDELKKTGLLDCILYLSGVSGSTWCMASLYEESNWSTNLDSVKEKIIQRLKGPPVTWGDANSKLKKYYNEKDIFSLTDVWAVLIVTSFVKEINEHKVSEQQVGHDKDPLPIYTVTDKGFKQQKNGDPWFEISPHEAGYSLTGAFVDVSKFGSQFEGGCKIKDQPEKDMLYLQALCGSAIADGDSNKDFIWEKIKEFFFIGKKELSMDSWKDKTQHTDIVYQVLMDVVEMNILVLKGGDPSYLDDDIRTKLTELTGEKCQLMFQIETGDVKQQMMQYSLDVCVYLRNWLSIFPFDVWGRTIWCMAKWIWGRTYNFLHKMNDDGVPTVLQDSEMRDFEDAGMLNNSPYMSVLRKEREVNLIISLDFSDGDPFLTVKTAAEMCKKENIPFPEVDVPPVDYPNDFYVFKGRGKVPTVIHIPLFNTVNCGDKVKEWRERYTTNQRPYRPDMIDPLVEVAGKNITNNKEKLLNEIQVCIRKIKRQGVGCLV